MNTTDPDRLEASVAAVREQVRVFGPSRKGTEARAAQSVSVHRISKPTRSWRITARLADSYRNTTKLSVSLQTVKFGKHSIKLPNDDILMFTSAGVESDTLTLWVTEVKKVLIDRPDLVTPANTLAVEASEALKRISEPTRRVAATRALRAITRAIENSPIQVLAEVASAATDVSVLVRALQQPDAIETLRSDDPLGPARLRGLDQRERLLRIEGGMLTAEEVAKHLNITRQAINKRRQQGSLIGLDAGRHGFLYPAWQFVQEGTIPDLASVLEALREHDPWMKHIFMVSANTRLDGETPLAALRSGRINDVKAAATAFGEHGAA